ncbi:hypothetical protein FORC79_1268 [Salmonella enterica subsp. enterica serovar Typhimurium]|nr:hypothetical protein FORC79_1268 [Salmonella enterica subsp. enterica serovar Typhimurium]
MPVVTTGILYFKVWICSLLLTAKVCCPAFSGFSLFSVTLLWFPYLAIRFSSSR